MTIRTLAIAAGAALVTVLPAMAMDCGQTADVMKALQEQYKEVPTFAGNANGVPIIIMVSPSGTWSIIGQRDAMSCMIASGDKWTAQTMDKVEPTPQALPTPALLPHHMLRIVFHRSIVGAW